MKKILLYTAVLVASVLFMTSCEKDQIGGTATQEMAGDWYVTAVAVDSVGNVVYTDDELFGLGHFHLDTYNTSSNSSTEMWINDNGTLWDFKTKMNIDLNAQTFQAIDAQNEAYDSKLTITNGQILYGAATTPSGMPADSIVFNVSFNDDTYPAQYGYKEYRVAGYRYTGFTKDN